MTDLVLDRVYALKFRPGMSLGAIEAEYRFTLTDIMTAYLEENRPITAFRNEMRRAANDAMTLAGYAGYADAGGSGALPDKVVSWIQARIDAEMGFINEVFQKLKELHKSGTPEEQQAFIGARAEGYTASLQGVYNYAQMGGQVGVMGVWRLGATEEHCPFCSAFHGLVAYASEWRELGIQPQNAPNPALTGTRHGEKGCEGWRCDCSLDDTDQRRSPKVYDTLLNIVSR